MILGDWQTDLTKLLAAVPGGGKVTSALNTATSDIEKRVRAEAEKGARAAIPEIRRQVNEEVRPYIIASLAAGGIGALTGLLALFVALRRS